MCLFLQKRPTAVVGMHGVLKADCVYVPIDLASPESRAARIVRSCQPKVILTDQSGARLLDKMVVSGQVELPDVIGSIDPVPGSSETFESTFHARDLQSFDPREPSCANTPADAAHILFTSGSTGDPKGVVITHANASEFVDWGTTYFGMSREDRVSGHPPLHFDLSTFDIYGTLAAGAVLHMVPAELNLLPPKLTQFIRESELTQWFSVPSVLTLLAKYDAVKQDDFPHMKRLLWCGEVLPTPTLMYLMHRLPHVEFTNLYGPTEATIASSYYTVRSRPGDQRDELPIGKACSGEALHVLDANLRPVPQGETGDLYISGVGLSPGYWLDPGKTESVFLTQDIDGESQRIYRTGDLARVGSDGLIYFLGRNDTQIKSRGYRIELGEIEMAMNALGFLDDCAIVGVPTGGFEGTAICCAYVAQQNAGITPQLLRSKVSSLIPKYMIPGRWQSFATLPKNGNGKTDRRKLKEIFESAAAT